MYNEHETSVLTFALIECRFETQLGTRNYRVAPQGVQGAPRRSLIASPFFLLGGQENANMCVLC